MKTVWKFPLVQLGVTQIEAPGCLEPLHFAMQEGIPTLWATVTASSAAKVTKKFQIVGTGHDIPIGSEYVGTAIDGRFVWHLFRVLQ